MRRSSAHTAIHSSSPYCPPTSIQLQFSQKFIAEVFEIIGNDFMQIHEDVKVRVIIDARTWALRVEVLDLDRASQRMLNQHIDDFMLMARRHTIAHVGEERSAISFFPKTLENYLEGGADI